MVKDANTPDTRSFEEIELESKMKEVKKLKEQLSKRDELIKLYANLVSEIDKHEGTKIEKFILREQGNKLKAEIE